MGEEVTVERLIAELKLRPMSAPKELCRAIHGTNTKTVRSKINSLLHKHQSIFQKNDPEPGKKAPRWSLAEGASPNQSQPNDGKPVCIHCRQIIFQGQEALHAHGICKHFFTSSQ
jgi:hypothetical protein